MTAKPMTARTTLIRNLDLIIAWDESDRRHVYLQNADLAFTGNEVVHAGPDFAGQPDVTIEGRGLMAMPGLVNIHSHPFSEPGNKGVTEEFASDKLGQSSLYEYLPVFGMEPQDAGASSRVAISELLKSGVTTVTDLSINRESWLDDLASTGIRAVVCPMYRSGYWYTKNGHEVGYAWDEKAARSSLRCSVADHRRAPRGTRAAGSPA